MLQQDLAMPPRRRLSWLASALATFPFFAAGPAAAEPVRIQGSTTFYAQVVEPNRQEIERLSRQKVEVVPNKSSHGLVALIEGRTQMAMISSPLADEIAHLKTKRADLPSDHLRAYEIARTRVALVAHGANPVRRLTLDDLGRILRGKIVNWKELGGRDLPITVVTVQPGGGVPTTVRAAVLGGEAFSAPSLIEVEAPRHVVKVTGQLEEALGITQLNLARQAALPELQLEGRIEQELYIVTSGEPDQRLRAVIEALRTVAAEHLL